MFDFLGWAKEGFKRSWAKVGFFEDIGITYIGVLDGHDLDELESAFEAAFKLRAPVLVHVKTIKGRGYAPAEQDSQSFHGASLPPIDLGLIDPTEEPLPTETEPKRKPKTYTQTFVEELVRVARPMRAIWAITAGMPTGTGLQRFCEHFPDRFEDVGIAEQHSVTMATGLALAGKRPVVALYSTFSQRAFDRLVHDVCQNDVPVLLALDRSGLVGEDGTSHQGMFMLPAMRALPNLVDRLTEGRQELRDLVVTALPRRTDVAALPARRRAGSGGSRGSRLEIGRGRSCARVRTSCWSASDRSFSVCCGSRVSLPRTASRLPSSTRWASMDEALVADHAAGKRSVVTAEDLRRWGLRRRRPRRPTGQASACPLYKVARRGFVHHGAGRPGGPAADRRAGHLGAGPWRAGLGSACSRTHEGDRCSIVREDEGAWTS